MVTRGPGAAGRDGCGWGEFKDKDGHRPVSESLRWIEGLRASGLSRLRQMPQTRLVYVADREGDMVELMQGARSGASGGLVDPLQHDRSLGKGAGKLSAALQDAPVLALSNSTWQRAKACR